MPDSQRKSQLAVIFATVFLYLLGFGIIIPILPMLSRDFGATPVQTGLLMSIYSLMQFLFSPFWGRLSDRLGRRPILLFCLFGEGLSYLLFAYAQDLSLLFVARALAGFFGASLGTASAAISDVTPPQERSKGMALIGAAFGLGFVFGPALGGGLTLWGQALSTEPHFGTRFAMIWVAGLCFATFLFAWKFLQETRSTHLPPVEKKSRFHLLKSNLTRPVSGWLMVVFFLSAFAMSSMEANLVLYMGEKFSWTVKDVSFGFAYVGLVMVFTQGFFVRRLLPLWGEKKVLYFGLILFALGFIGIGMATHVLHMALAMTFLALGNGLTNPSLLGSISLLTPSDEQGLTLGVTQSLSSLGRILGPAFGGWLYQSWKIESPFLTSGFLALSGLLLVLWLGRRLPEAAKKGS